MQAHDIKTFDVKFQFSFMSLYAQRCYRNLQAIYSLPMLEGDEAPDEAASEDVKPVPHEALLLLLPSPRGSLFRSLVCL